jgi:hypothetical protein
MIERLGSRIVKKGLISENDLKKALERQRLYGGRIGFNLIELGLITEADLNDLFHFKPIQPHNVSETGIDANFLADLILKHCLFMKKFMMRDLSKKHNYHLLSF